MRGREEGGWKRVVEKDRRKGLKREEGERKRMTTMRMGRRKGGAWDEGKKEGPIQQLDKHR